MSRPVSVPLALAGGLFLASVVPAVPFFLDPRPFREVAGGVVHLSLYSLSLAALLALLVAVPGLRRLTSATGRRLPDGVLAFALVATALNAATQFVQVVITPDLAATAPAALDETGTIQMVGLMGAWVMFLAAWVVLAGVGMHRRVLSTPSGILLIIGAIAQPAIGPVAALPLGLALLLIARAGARPAQPAADRQPVAA
jgi:hypothetical protein